MKRSYTPDFYRVIVPKVIVRSSPDSSTKENLTGDKLEYGKIFQVYEVVDDANGRGYIWGRINMTNINPAQYVCLDDGYVVFAKSIETANFKE